MNHVKQCPNCSTMLRFPDTQGTILVQCPVCSHRFTFDPEIETEIGFGKNNPEIPSFHFKPTFQNYKDLMVDLLYAPIDYLKSKQGNRKKQVPWIPILLFSIFFLYLWKWSMVKDPKLTPSHSAPEIEGEPNFGNTPFDFVPPEERMPISPNDGENQSPEEPKSPGFEI